MLTAILLASFVLQAAAAVLAFTIPAPPKARKPIWIASAMFALMAVRRLIRLVGTSTTEGADLNAEALLEVTVAGLALFGVLGLRRLWKDTGSALAGALAREARRRESEELWIRVFEFAPDGYLMIEFDGTLRRVNRAAAEMTGQSREQVEGRLLGDIGILDPANREQAMRIVAGFGAGDSPPPTEYTLRRPDGTTLQVEATGYPVELQGRRLLLSILRDVTHRRQVEDKLRRKRLRLEEAQRVAGLVTFETDLVADTIWVSDDPRLGTFAEGNGSTLTLAEAFDFIVEADRERVSRAMAASVARDGSGELAVEYRQRIPVDGEERTMRTTARVQRDGDGVPIRMIGATLDVTELRRAEREIRSLNAGLEERVRERTGELQRTMEELEAFSYSVSHDLRSPLRAMAGYSQMVLDEDGRNLSEMSREELERIRASSVRMAGLIDGLLSLSRLTRRTRHDIVVDMTGIAGDVVAELRRLEPSREVEVHLQEGLTALADPAMMSLVLQNLLGNAWKFTRLAEDARIDFGCEPGGVFYVRDNGVGFDPSQAAKIFRPFQRLHHSDEFEGTGIGLATVGRIVRHYGGRVWADGAIDEGSTFRFTLTREAAEVTRPAA